MSKRKAFSHPNDYCIFADMDTQIIDVLPVFLSRVVAGCNRDQCWAWNGAKNHDGYATYTTVFRGRKRTLRLSRIMYEVIHGPIPSGLVIDHLCRNRHCINPLHLQAVTPLVNYERGHSPAALNKKKTHCKRGHEFTPENTWLYKVSPQNPNGGRMCRTCKRMHDTMRMDRRRPDRVRRRPYKKRKSE